MFKTKRQNLNYNLIQRILKVQLFSNLMTLKIRKKLAHLHLRELKGSKVNENKLQ